jgi:hypothetical protein
MQDPSPYRLSRRFEPAVVKRYNQFMKSIDNNCNEEKSPAESGARPVRRCRIVNLAHSFQEAREWEIQQELSMTPAQRQQAAKELKERFYGKNAPDVRQAERSR